MFNNISTDVESKIIYTIIIPLYLQSSQTKGIQLQGQQMKKNKRRQISQVKPLVSYTTLVSVLVEQTLQKSAPPVTLCTITGGGDWAFPNCGGF